MNEEPNFISEWLPIVASWASIIGLIWTIWVFFVVRSVNNRLFLFKARVPDLIKSLSDHASQISDYRNDFDNFIPQIKLELGRVEADLKNLQKKLSRSERKSVKQLLKKIKAYDPNSGVEENSWEKFLERIKLSARKSNGRDGLWDIYAGIDKLLQELKHYQEDIRWEQ